VKTYLDPPEAPAGTGQRYRLHGPTMGSRYSAVFYTAAAVDEAAIAARLSAAVDAVDRQMSSWKADSDLNRLNSAPVDAWLRVPHALFDVLEAAMRVSRESQGAFDIGVGDLVTAWGFGPANGQIDEARIKTLASQAHRPASDFLDLDREHGRVRKRVALSLDLSGIAKGYGVDELARCLDRLGIPDYLVGIDGEMRARGCKPGGQPWAIAIEKPVRHRREVMGVMELDNAAIATSGDYRHWVEHEGRSRAHTMNGIRRAPAENRLAAVSVVATSAMLADAWATALLVLGERAGIELARQRAMDALFVLHDGEGFREVSLVGGVPADDASAAVELASGAAA